VDNIHLTLKFLGDVSLANLSLIKQAMDLEAPNYPEFDISIGNLGAFPKTRAPRVVWVGVESPDSLHALQRSIESQMARLGYEPDRRPFSAHLTLGRISRNALSGEIQAVSRVIESCKVGFIGLTPVRDVRLYQSDLHPEGAVYTCLHTSSLSVRPPLHLG
jgi:RNA 2',3'-cyclic 3'-phosphodiesterase